MLIYLFIMPMLLNKASPTTDVRWMCAIRGLFYVVLAFYGANSRFLFLAVLG